MNIWQIIFDSFIFLNEYHLNLIYRDASLCKKISYTWFLDEFYFNCMRKKFQLDQLKPIFNTPSDFDGYY